MSPPPSRLRTFIARAYTLVEDVVYVALGLFLAALVLTLLVHGVVDLGHLLLDRSVPLRIVAFLDRILLILLIVELLYTVQLSFREHSITAEPFLLVGLISVIRRVLLLTTALGERQERGEVVPMVFMVELGVLAVLIFVLALALVMLRRLHGRVSAERA